MLAFLKLFSPREWLLLAALAAVSILAYRIYVAGEHKIEAADAKTAAAQVVHNEEVESRVKSGLAKALAAYLAAHTTPPPPPAPVPRLVCRAAGGGQVPSGPSPVAASNGAGTNPAAPAAQADAGFDPAPAVSADGTAYDALIDHYLAKIKLLQQTVKAYQDGGLVAK